MFAAPELTFERSRRFDVDDVSDDELHDIAETIRRRHLQQSVLTFDRLHPGDPDVDAVELEVPGVSARALREGLLEDAEARERLFGGSVTLDRRLLLVAALEDAEFARGFAKRIGGDVRRATTRYGDREFVEVATAGRARIERGRLLITGTAEDDTVALREGRRLEIDFGADGIVDFEVSRHRFDRVRVELGEGQDRLIQQGARSRAPACRPASTPSSGSTSSSAPAPAASPSTTSRRPARSRSSPGSAAPTGRSTASPPTLPTSRSRT